jgi:hypothetical protein
MLWCEDAAWQTAGRFHATHLRVGHPNLDLVPPTTLWTPLRADQPPEDHLVQLYGPRDFPAGSIASWLGHAFPRGGGVVVIGTPEHRAAIREALRAEGHDAAALEAGGRLLLLDAEETMARFLRDGQPDRAAFHEALGNAVGRLRHAVPGGEVRAWGEMVDLLAWRGQVEAAMTLEELWNEALAVHGIRLLCSYRADPFDPAFYPAQMRVFAHGHGRMLPAGDEEAFDKAVRDALREVCGPDWGERLAAAVAHRRLTGIDAHMPEAQRLVAALVHVVPHVGREVLQEARARYPSAAPGGPAGAAPA